MKLAAIDIGSNAVRLLIVSVIETTQGPCFVKESMIRIPLRLGEESFLHGKFSKAKQKKLIHTMEAFSLLMKVQDVDTFRAYATSAMREASNSQETAKKVLKKTGIKIEVISGQREAELIFSNHAEKLSTQKHKNYLYIDVGGGSTELILINKGKLIDKWSFNIGTLRVKHGKIKEKHWREMSEWLRKHTEKYSPLHGIGSGGNINSIIKHFGTSNNKEISRPAFMKTYELLSKKSPTEISVEYGLRTDRADVMVPAMDIFKFIIDITSMPSIFVPKMGLPDGMVHEMYEELKVNK